MLKIKEIMTPGVEVISPFVNLIECARKMKELNLGALPVCLEDRLVGMVTDRDLVVRGLTEENFNQLGTTSVQEVMSAPIVYCYEDDPIEKAARLMEVKQIRRVAVVNRQRKPVGMISLADIATKTFNEELTGEILEKITEPNFNEKRRISLVGKSSADTDIEFSN